MLIQIHNFGFGPCGYIKIDTHDEGIQMWIEPVGTDPNVDNGKEFFINPNITYHTSQNGSRLRHDARRVPIIRVQENLAYKMVIRLWVLFPSNIDSCYRSVKIRFGNLSPFDIVENLPKMKQIIKIE